MCLVRGNPMCDRPCSIAMYDGTEVIAHYDGYFHPKRKTWTLYIAKNYTGRSLKGKISCGEMDIEDKR